jgi:hypothetical protein
MVENSMTPRFSRTRWNKLRAEGVAMYNHFKELCIDELMVEGAPPLTADLSESEEYHKLATMALAGDPRYLADPAAKRRLAELSLRYGPPPDYPVPIGHHFPQRPAQEAAAMKNAATPSYIS